MPPRVAKPQKIVWPRETGVLTPEKPLLDLGARLTGFRFGEPGRSLAIRQFDLFWFRPARDRVPATRGRNLMSAASAVGCGFIPLGTIHYSIAQMNLFGVRKQCRRPAGNRRAQAA